MATPPPFAPGPDDWPVWRVHNPRQGRRVLFWCAVIVLSTLLSIAAWGIAAFWGIVAVHRGAGGIVALLGGLLLLPDPVALIRGIRRGWAPALSLPPPLSLARPPNAAFAGYLTEQGVEGDRGCDVWNRFESFGEVQQGADWIFFRLTYGPPKPRAGWRQVVGWVQRTALLLIALWLGRERAGSAEAWTALWVAVGAWAPLGGQLLLTRWRRRERSGCLAVAPKDASLRQVRDRLRRHLPERPFACRGVLEG